MKPGACIIVGAADFSDKLFYLLPESDRFVIAADGGLDKLLSAKITPDLVLGDFDSSKLTPPKGALLFDSVKNDTDTEIAAKEGLERGYKDFIFLGVLGGARPDHTLGAIQTGAYLATNGCTVKLLADGYTIHILSGGTRIELSAKKQGYVSLIAYGGDAVVSVTGLKYELKNGKLDPYHTLGISNEFTGKKSEITVHCGTVVIYEY